MAFIEVDDFDFDDILKREFENGQKVIIKFGSQFCDACNALEFELEEIDEKYENITILEVECADSEELTTRYNITKVPTMVIYEDSNTTLWHKDGVMLADDIEKLFS